MKTHRIILFIIFLLGTVVFEIKAQNNNMPERNWSQWSEWNNFECAKKLFFRIRYYETSSKGLYNWQVEFRNDYSEDLYFNYGLEESYKTHKIYGAESVQPIKANSTYISDNQHYVWQTNTNKFKEVDVYIFHVCMGRGNWEQTYPKYYSECKYKKKEININTYFEGKWNVKRRFYHWSDGGIDGGIEGEELTSSDSLDLISVIIIDNFIIFENDTLKRISENLYRVEKKYSVPQIMESYFNTEIQILDENSFIKKFNNWSLNYSKNGNSKYSQEGEFVYSRNVGKDEKNQNEIIDDEYFIGTINANINSNLCNSFIDIRDNKKYKTIKIGNQEWMAENLNYSTGNSWCYDNSSSNCNTYGRLYDWETAKKACPSGWHLPSKSEFETLLGYYGEEDRIIYTALILNSNLGFNVQFAGFYDFDGISKYAYHGIGDYNIYWTSTPYNENKMWFLSISRNDENARMNGEFGNLNLGFSVRCIHD